MLNFQTFITLSILIRMIWKFYTILFRYKWYFYKKIIVQNNFNPLLKILELRDISNLKFEKIYDIDIDL